MYTGQMYVIKWHNPLQITPTNAILSASDLVYLHPRIRPADPWCYPMLISIWTKGMVIGHGKLES